MKEVCPCKGCTDRHTACHDSCDKYQEWLARDHAQKKHLQDQRYRFHIPMTSAREKAYENYYFHHRKSSKGGSYE